MCLTFRGNVLQNCQYEEIFKGHEDCRSQKFSVCLAIYKNIVFILILWHLRLSAFISL